MTKISEQEKNIYDKLKPDIYKKIKKRLKVEKNILDVGCGDCQLVNFLAKHTSNRVVGVDISNNSFKKANEQAIKSGTLRLVKCKKMDAHRLRGFKDNIFDAAVMVYSLHEFDKPVLVLRQIHRVLKGKGKILIVDFPKGSKAEKLWGEKYFTPKQVKSMLNQAKFNGLDINYPYGNELLLFASGKKMK